MAMAAIMSASSAFMVPLSELLAECPRYEPDQEVDPKERGPQHEHDQQHVQERAPLGCTAAYIASIASTLLSRIPLQSHPWMGVNPSSP